MSRDCRVVVRWLGLWLLTLPAAAQTTPTAPAAPAAPSVWCVGMTVRDLETSMRFYTDVLHFHVVARAEHEGAAEEHALGVFGLHTDVARLQLGDEFLELTEFLAPRGRPLPEDSRSNDRWFQHIAIIVRDMDAAYAELRRHHVRHASPSPQTLPDWNPNAGGIRAFYFQDPDGHPLEVLQFPLGKGDARWHRPTDELFLGIDHTAIVVADTDQSLRFWRDELGFTVVGHSDNYGVEQERLNNLFGAHLAITTLRGHSGPGVELLEYVSPRGRRMPEDTVANDLWHWVVTVQVGSDDRHFAANGKTVARGSRLLVRDPDGHRAMLSAAARADAASR